MTFASAITKKSQTMKSYKTTLVDLDLELIRAAFWDINLQITI